MNIEPKPHSLHRVNDALLFLRQSGDCRLILLLDALSPFTEVFIRLLIPFGVKDALGGFTSGGIIEYHTVQPVYDLMKVGKSVGSAAVLAEYIMAVVAVDVIIVENGSFHRVHNLLTALI